jgi:hypothetical protein
VAQNGALGDAGMSGRVGFRATPTFYTRPIC